MPTRQHWKGTGAELGDWAIWWWQRYKQRRSPGACSWLPLRGLGAHTSNCGTFLVPVGLSYAHWRHLCATVPYDLQPVNMYVFCLLYNPDSNLLWYSSISHLLSTQCPIFVHLADSPLSFVSFFEVLSGIFLWWKKIITTSTTVFMRSSAYLILTELQGCTKSISCGQLLQRQKSL